jgi:4'-phosphopantetheinyl transferase
VEREEEWDTDGTDWTDRHGLNKDWMMIQWLVQTSGAYPEAAPAAWLSGRERARLAELRVEKRRREWLLGRWTAKRLWQAVAWQQTGTVRPLASLVIERDGMGAPVCVGEEVTVSISHCRDYAFCAAVAGANGVLGVDMEFVEARPAGFAEGYFTAAELELVEQAGEERDWLVTAIWSAKEAALKAMRLGLTVDCRAVSCLVEGRELRGTRGNSRNSGELKREGELSIVNGQWSIVNEEGKGWIPFEIGWDEGRLGRKGRPLQGWWRAWNGYVLTVACGLEI